MIRSQCEHYPKAVNGSVILKLHIERLYFDILLGYCFWRSHLCLQVIACYHGGKEIWYRYKRM